MARVEYEKRILRGFHLHQGTTVSRNLKKKTHFTYSANNSKNQHKGNVKDHSYGSGGSNPNKNNQKDKSISQYGRQPQQTLEQGSRPQEKPKREGWSYNRKFTPLDQSLETVLEYMLGSDMIKLPRVARSTNGYG